MPSRCASCGTFLEEVEVGKSHLCPKTLRRRPTVEVRDKDAKIGDPAGRPRDGGAP